MGVAIGGRATRERLRVMRRRYEDALTAAQSDPGARSQARLNVVINLFMQATGFAKLGQDISSFVSERALNAAAQVADQPNPQTGANGRGGSGRGGRGGGGGRSRSDPDSDGDGEAAGAIFSGAGDDEEAVTSSDWIKEAVISFSPPPQGEITLTLAKK